MKVKLLRQNRIDGKAGDIVEVSPARAAFLFETKSAVPAYAIRERTAEPVKTAAKTATKKTTRKTNLSK
jgi:ribosomal protein L9